MQFRELLSGQAGDVTASLEKEIADTRNYLERLEALAATLGVPVQRNGKHRKNNKASRALLLRYLHGKPPMTAKEIAAANDCHAAGVCLSLRQARHLFEFRDDKWTLTERGAEAAKMQQPPATATV